MAKLDFLKTNLKTKVLNVKKCDKIVKSDGELSDHMRNHKLENLRLEIKSLNLNFYRSHKWFMLAS